MAMSFILLDVPEAAFSVRFSRASSPRQRFLAGPLEHCALAGHRCLKSVEAIEQEREHQAVTPAFAQAAGGAQRRPCRDSWICGRPVLPCREY